jgi:hypothetical protein
LFDPDGGDQKFVRDKKQQERQIVSEFARLSGELVGLDVLECESPDFLARGPDGVLGLEVVKFLRGQGSHGSLLHQREQFKENVATQSRKLAQAISDVPLQVLLTWWPRDLPKSDARALARGITDLVLGHIPTEAHQLCDIERSVIEGTAVDGQIHSISIVRLRQGATACWSSIDVGFAGTSHEEIQAILDSKENKVPGYRTQCDEVWLIIGAGITIGLSSHVDMTLAITDHAYVTSFDRVYLVDFTSSRCVLLPVDRR